MPEGLANIGQQSAVGLEEFIMFEKAYYHEESRYSKEKDRNQDALKIVGEGETDLKKQGSREGNFQEI